MMHTETRTRTYRNILHASKPISNRPKMSLDNRAKIFAPFAALRGFDISILTAARERTLEPRATPSDQMQEEIGRIIQDLCIGEPVRLTWFEAKNRLVDITLGEYRTETVIVRGIDCERQLLLTDGPRIPFADIRDIAPETPREHETC